MLEPLIKTCGKCGEKMKKQKYKKYLIIKNNGPKIPFMKKFILRLCLELQRRIKELFKHL